MERSIISNQSQTIISVEEIHFFLTNLFIQKILLKQFIPDQSLLIYIGFKQGILSAEKIKSILA